MRHRRSGFTLVELLVVISILLILSTLVLAVFNTGRSSDRMRSAARVAQSAFLGAKDRALHAKDLRGVRLTRDLTDTTLVNGFVYLQPFPMLTYPTGAVQLERLDLDGNSIADSADIVIVRGFSSPASPPVDWDTKVQFFPSPGRIRIPTGTGQWYTFTWTTTGINALNSGNEVLQLTTPFVQTSGSVPFNAVVAYPPTNTLTSSCDIQLGNDVLPFHQPISFSSGVVIDLKYCSNNVQTLAGIGVGTPYVDIMFSPRGSVSGPLAGLGPLHFLMRDLKDAANTNVNPWAVGSAASANPDTNQGDRMILTVFPQTGLVQIFEVDPTDNFANPSTTTPITYPGTGSPDGIADNLFNFAQQGRAAGR